MQLADHIKVRGPRFLPGPCRKGFSGGGGCQASLFLLPPLGREEGCMAVLALPCPERAHLPPQFTQSALDCMSVEVCRLRSFLQVRACPTRPARPWRAESG